MGPRRKKTERIIIPNRPRKTKRLCRIKNARCLFLSPSDYKNFTFKSTCMSRGLAAFFHSRKPITLDGSSKVWYTYCPESQFLLRKFVHLLLQTGWVFALCATHISQRYITWLGKCYTEIYTRWRKNRFLHPSADYPFQMTSNYPWNFSIYGRTQTRWSNYLPTTPSRVAGG